MPALTLSLYREYFVAILDGSKKTEFRRRCPHWDRILANKSYTHIHFINGYGATRPCMDVCIARLEKTPREWRIHLGGISGKKNLHLLKAPS